MGGGYMSLVAVSVGTGNGVSVGDGTGVSVLGRVALAVGSRVRVAVSEVSGVSVRVIVISGKLGGEVEVSAGRGVSLAGTV